jgi:3-methyladenine DNA glycosylase AlkD
MDLAEALKKLETAGTEQNRTVYARHGVRAEMFGVSYASLGKLRKAIGTDHEIARGLWASGNHDAAVLATMVADPAAVTSSELDAWARDLDSYVITDALAGFVAQTPHAHAKMEKWTKSKREWVGRAGWVLVAGLARTDESLPESWFLERIKLIEAGIHRKENRVRDAMNMALISIGMRSPRLEKRAMAAAKRIGTVEVDHGETGCRTPDAIAYIERAKARREADKKD